MKETPISPATKRNWEKLHIDGKDRLKARANKRLSEKRFAPVGYLTDASLRALGEKLAEMPGNTMDKLYSLGLGQLMQSGIAEKPHVQAFLSRFSCKMIPELLQTELPEGDALGYLYQMLLPEGKRSENGVYYTPKRVASSLCEGLSFAHGERLLDPCCGSGAFFLSLGNAEPGQLYGIDTDETALMIAGINLLLQYQDREFTPKLYLFDFLSKKKLPFSADFDYIVANPPWGQLKEDKHSAFRDRFADFFIRAYAEAKENAEIRFLFPEAFLRIGAHTDLRRFMLEKGTIEKISLYQRPFAGVFSGSAGLFFAKKKEDTNVLIKKEGQEPRSVPQSVFSLTAKHIFFFPTEKEREKLALLQKKAAYTLKDSLFALGIVTGDNKNILKNEPADGLEPIFLGRDISPYALGKPQFYIDFDRKKLQQAAKEEFYRAEEKLVYRFIAKRPVVAYDDEKRLFLNSANILIPKIPGMSPKTVMAFLNSAFYGEIYQLIFGDLKILKSDLCELPFPKLLPEEDAYFSALAEDAIKGKRGSTEAIDRAVEAYFMQ